METGKHKRRRKVERTSHRNNTDYKDIWKVLALDHVDICVKRGDIYGLIGDNGAGKSTLLKLLAGHSAASTGEIRLFGEQGEKELQRARRRSGVMIEQPGFSET